MQKSFSKIALKDMLHLTIENMKKRRSRILLTIGNVFLGVSLVSSMMMLSLSHMHGSISPFVFIHLTEYQLWVSIISISVCIITIFNSMLIAVTERYKEIGTMKCLGAKDSLILYFFILESLIISFIGGSLGFIVSFIFTAPIILIQSGGLISIQNYLSILIISFLISVLINLIATKINPAETLRFEV